MILSGVQTILWIGKVMVRMLQAYGKQLLQKSLLVGVVFDPIIESGIGIDRPVQRPGTHVTARLAVQTRQQNVTFRAS